MHISDFIPCIDFFFTVTSRIMGFLEKLERFLSYSWAIFQTLQTTLFTHRYIQVMKNSYSAVASYSSE